MSAHPTDEARVGGLDGLRGLAISLVLLAHVFGVEGAGMVGVLVFFALSGYLITWLLLAEHDRRAGVDLVAFYCRRAARLLPALLVFLCVFVGFIAVVDVGVSVRDAAPGLVQSLLYVTDFTLGFQAGYQPELAHLWSLAVEEQFYLLWPICLMLLLRASGDVRLRMVAASLCLIAVVRVVTLGMAPALGLFVYSLPTTWMDVLLLGALCALLRRDAPALWNRLARVAATPWVSAAALAGLIAYSVVPGSYRWAGTYVVGIPLLAILAVGLVVAVTSPGRSWALAVLRWRPLRSIGLVSYGLYLYNSTSIMLTQRLLGAGLPQRLLGLAVAVVLAWVSWRWVERWVQQGVRARLARTRQGASSTRTAAVAQQTRP